MRGKKRAPLGRSRRCARGSSRAVDTRAPFLYTTRCWAAAGPPRGRAAWPARLGRPADLAAAPRCAASRPPARPLTLRGVGGAEHSDPETGRKIESPERRKIPSCPPSLCVGSSISFGTGAPHVLRLERRCLRTGRSVEESGHLLLGRLSRLANDASLLPS